MSQLDSNVNAEVFFKNILYTTVQIQYIIMTRITTLKKLPFDNRKKAHQELQV